MITMHRFPLPSALALIDKVWIAMPKGAEIKLFGISPSDGALSIWALVDTTQIPIDRSFEIFGTGQLVSLNAKDFRDELSYIGTCFDRQFVWHLFERI